MQDEDWLALERDIISAFTPGTPINEAELLAGRSAKTQQLQMAALDAGRHALVYGERGVGKSSIANTFHGPLNSPTRTVIAVPINCDYGDTFDSMWRKVFRRLKHVAQDGSESWADEAHVGSITVDDVVTELSSFPAEYCPIIILDEFDRLRDQACKTLISDVIKSLSDYAANCTLVMVGVATSIVELIENHASVQRAIKQVPINRLQKSELSEIVSIRLRRLGMTIEPHALWRITFLSSGLPFYTHAIGRQAALHAVSRKRRRINEDDVFTAMGECIADVDHSMKDAYVRATEKLYHKSNTFAEVLAACALAEPDALGKFSALSVEDPLGEIIGKPMKTASFGFHLNELARPERGSLLTKSGDRGKFRFCFVEPLMQPFILMTSLTNGLISKEMMARRMATAQMSLPNVP